MARRFEREQRAAELITYTDGKSRNFHREQTILELKVNGFEVRILAEEFGRMHFAKLKASVFCYTSPQTLAKGQIYVFYEFNFHKVPKSVRPGFMRKGNGKFHGKAS
jgi:hypothetical protein